MARSGRRADYVQVQGVKTACAWQSGARTEDFRSLQPAAKPIRLARIPVEIDPPSL